MNRAAAAIIRFYTALLRLYPTHFRAEFAGEMADVFTQNAHESSQGGGCRSCSYAYPNSAICPAACFRNISASAGKNTC
jgi:hypothetical protein